MVAEEPGFHRGFHQMKSWKNHVVPGTKGPRRSSPLKCSHLERGESMKDPVSIFGCWRGFHFASLRAAGQCPVSEGSNTAFAFKALQDQSSRNALPPSAFCC